jgi:hypothetical protein
MDCRSAQGNLIHLRQSRFAKFHQDEVQREQHGGPDESIRQPHFVFHGHTGYL